MKRQAVDQLDAQVDAFVCVDPTHKAKVARKPNECAQGCLPNSRYRSLDMWRAIACLAVVIHHSAYEALPLERINNFSLAKEGPWGVAVVGTFWLALGVPMFFVISGYCIGDAADRHIAQRRSVTDFFLRRVRRIYPPYLVFLLIATLLIMLSEAIFPGLFTEAVGKIYHPASLTLSQWFGNLTLTESWRQNFFGGEPRYAQAQIWSLCYEEQFYAIVGIVLCFSRRYVWQILAGLTVVVALLNRSGIGHGTFLDGRWLHFAAGLAVYWAIQHARPWQRRCVFFAMMAIAGSQLRDLSLVLTPAWHARKETFVAFSFAALILFLAKYDQRLSAYKLSKLLQGVGVMTYSTYLVHWPIAVAVSHAAWMSGVRSDQLTLCMTVPLCVFTSLAIAALFYRLVERRFLSRSALSAEKNLDATGIPIDAAASWSVGSPALGDEWPMRPFVSIIVPMFNEAERIEGLLSALAAQTYPRERFEVIVVDNGSADDSVSRCERFAACRMRIAHEARKGPDAARNCGLKLAQGDIMAFTDADCRPRPGWLLAGVEALSGKAELVGGAVSFKMSEVPTLSEIYDSISFLQQDHSISARGIAFTANLFVKRRVFDVMGPFPVLAGWNGDAAFTGNATRAGHVMSYAPDAIVDHPARRFEELSAKVHRIGYGKGSTGAQFANAGIRTRAGGQAKTVSVLQKPHVINLWPPALRRALNKRQLHIAPFQLLGLWALSVWMLLIGAWAYASGAARSWVRSWSRRVSLYGSDA